MKKIAKFEKVSYEQFEEAMLKLLEETESPFIDETFKNVVIKNLYDGLELPKRATTGSAGYDFHSPIGITLKSGESIKVPTGIRVRMDEGWVMLAVPRSSMGVKKNIVLKNTVCVGDSDYYNADNEGHYFMCIKNTGDKTIRINAGERFIQAFFVPFGITEDDDTEGIRTGGVGSTGV